MSSSTSFFRLHVLICLTGLLSLAGGSVACAAGDQAVSAPIRAMRIAVLPMINLSGNAAPLKELHAKVLTEVKRRGMTVVAEEELGQFMSRHRLRYTGGLDAATARAFHDQVAADAVLIMSLQQYDPIYPPKIALDARLVSTAEIPGIVWADAVAMSGDEAPGLFGTGLIDNAAELTDTALHRLCESLAGGLGRSPAPQIAARYRPKIFYRSVDLKPARTARVAVVPFFNRSQRSNAGEMLALQFVRELARQGGVTVIEPGLVRQKFLAFRIIMNEGPSLANADILFEVLDADLIVSGDVMEYDDYEGGLGTPRAAFSAWMLDRSNRRVVWASESHNSGDDGVYFFDINRQRTVQGLARNMVRGVSEQMLPPSAAGVSDTPAP